MTRGKGKGQGGSRTVRVSCQRCTQLSLFCDAPGSCTECRKRGCNCNPAGNEVPAKRKTAVGGNPRVPDRFGGRFESSRFIRQSPPTAPPPAGQLPQGWQCFHDSEANRDYYVSPTGHIQWGHPLQGPTPPPLPQSFPSQARGFPVGTVGVADMNGGLRHPSQDNKRKRGEEDVRELPAPFRTRAYGIEKSTNSRPVVQGFPIQPNMNTNSSAGAPPSGPRSMRQFRSRGEFLGSFRCNGGPARGRPGGLQRGSRTTTALPFNRSGEGTLPSQAAHDEAEGSQEASEQTQTKAHDEAIKTEEESVPDEQELVEPQELAMEEAPRDFGLRSRSRD